MSVKINHPRGTADILPSEVSAWTRLEETARDILRNFAYREIRTPLFEETALFKRSLGETTEVVNKQLLEVLSQRKASAGAQDARGEDTTFALRPEGTAPVVRAFNQHDMGREEFLSKFFYIAPMFRGERPQKGRLRQFHQIGVEAIGRGADHPLLDAEMIILAVRLLLAFGVKGFKVRVNSLGSREDKAGFALWLREQLRDKIHTLSPECQDQYQRNVFRLLDSKDPDCQAVIRSLSIEGRHLSESGRQYFDAVLAALTGAGIDYEVSGTLVRGLDYYTHTVFEIIYEGLGAQDALGAGGRYNGLIEQLGGGDRRNPGPVGAIGFALGMERILLAIEHQDPARVAIQERLDVFVVTGGAELEPLAFKLLGEIRAAGVSAEMDFGHGRTFKKQFEQADRRGARVVVILGADEAASSVVSIKDMASGTQKQCPQDGLAAALKNILVTKH